jgi:hypothetical protein
MEAMPWSKPVSGSRQASYSSGPRTFLLVRWWGRARWHLDFVARSELLVVVDDALSDGLYTRLQG